MQSSCEGSRACTHSTGLLGSSAFRTGVHISYFLRSAQLLTTDLTSTQPAQLFEARGWAISSPAPAAIPNVLKPFLPEEKILKHGSIMTYDRMIESKHLNVHVCQLEPRYPQGTKRNSAAFDRQEWQDRVNGP